MVLLAGFCWESSFISHLFSINEFGDPNNITSLCVHDLPLNQWGDPVAVGLTLIFGSNRSQSTSTSSSWWFQPHLKKRCASQIWFIFPNFWIMTNNIIETTNYLPSRNPSWAQGHSPPQSILIFEIPWVNGQHLWVVSSHGTVILWFQTWVFLAYWPHFPYNHPYHLCMVYLPTWMVDFYGKCR